MTGPQGRLHGVGWALADQCVVSAVNFLTIFLFARFLDTAVFGRFVLANTGLLLLTNVQNALLVQPHNVLGAALQSTEYRRFTAALALAQVAFCTTACTLLGAAAWLVSLRGPHEVGAILAALALAAAPWMAQEFVRRVLYTRGQTGAALLNDTLSYGLQLCGAAWLALERPASATPQAALAVLGCSSLAGVLLGIRQLRGHLQFGSALSPAAIVRSWHEAWGFGKWLIGQNALTWLGAQGHSWVVALLLGAGQVGYYRAATHLVNLMNPVLQTAFSYLPSRASTEYRAHGPAALSRWIGRTQRLLLLAALPFCVLLAGFPSEVLRLAFGGRYTGTGMSQILVLTTLATTIAFAKFPYDLGLLALRSTRSIFYVYLIPVVLLFTSGVALVHTLGVLGVPLSAIVINLSLLAATRQACRRQLARAKERAGAFACGSA